MSDRFLSGIDAKAREAMGEDVLGQARMCLADYVACAFLGQRMLEDHTDAILRQTEAGAGHSVVIGSGTHAPAHIAALLNGMNAHVTELDDGQRYAMLHCGAPVISALLAMAGAGNLTGERLLFGIVMGYEATVRLASAIQPGHKLKGLHATGTCGTVGAALGLAYALNYEAGQRKATLSAALTDSMALLQMMDDVSTLKPYNVGRAAVAGIDAALVGGAGFCGPHDALGGKRGFLQLMADGVDESMLTRGYESTWAIQTVYRKPYAACRHAHAPIEAALLAREEGGVLADGIDRVDVQTYGLAVAGHDHRHVTGMSSAKMSIPYAVAVALVTGDAGYAEFASDRLADERVRSLAERVYVTESPELSALVPAKRAAVVTLWTGDESHRARVDYPKGEPENPMTMDDLRRKFQSLVTAAGVAESQVQLLWDSILHVDDGLDGFLGALEMTGGTS